MKFDKATLRVLRPKIQAALSDLFTDCDVQLSRTMTYAPNGSSMKFSIEVFAENAGTRAENDWKILAPQLGLKADDFGRIFNLDGTGYEVVGISPRRTKYPIVVKRVTDGKQFGITISTYRRAEA